MNNKLGLIILAVHFSYVPSPSLHTSGPLMVSRSLYSHWSVSEPPVDF